MTRQAAATSPSPWRLRLAWALFALLVIGLAAGLAVWQYRYLLESQREAALERTADDAIENFSKGLPRRFAPGLTLIAVRREGADMVFIIASDKHTAAEAHRDPQSLAEVRNRELLQLREYCDIPSMARLLVSGVRVHRLFIDQGGGVFFQVSLTANDCRVRAASPLAESGR